MKVNDIAMEVHNVGTPKGPLLVLKTPSMHKKYALE